MLLAAGHAAHLPIGEIDRSGAHIREGDGLGDLVNRGDDDRVARSARWVADHGAVDLSLIHI